MRISIYAEKTFSDGMTEEWHVVDSVFTNLKDLEDTIRNHTDCMHLTDFTPRMITERLVIAQSEFNSDNVLYDITFFDCSTNIRYLIEEAMTEKGVYKHFDLILQMVLQGMDYDSAADAVLEE